MRGIKFNGRSYHTDSHVVIFGLEFLVETLEHWVVCPEKVLERLGGDVGDLFPDNSHALLSRANPLDLKLREPWQAPPLDHGPARLDGLVELTAVGGNEGDLSEGIDDIPAVLTVVGTMAGT